MYACARVCVRACVHVWVFSAAIHRDTGETLAIKKLYRPLGSKLHGKRAHREIQLLMHLGSSESNVGTHAVEFGVNVKSHSLCCDRLLGLIEWAGACTTSDTIKQSFLPLVPVRFQPSPLYRGLLCSLLLSTSQRLQDNSYWLLLLPYTGNSFNRRLYPEYVGGRFQGYVSYLSGDAGLKSVVFRNLKARRVVSKTLYKSLRRAAK